MNYGDDEVTNSGCLTTIILLVAAALVLYFGLRWLVHLSFTWP